MNFIVSMTQSRGQFSRCAWCHILLLSTMRCQRDLVELNSRCYRLHLQCAVTSTSKCSRPSSSMWHSNLKSFTYLAPNSLNAWESTRSNISYNLRLSVGWYRFRCLIKLTGLWKARQRLRVSTWQTLALSSWRSRADQTWNATGYGRASTRRRRSRLSKASRLKLTAVATTWQPRRLHKKITVSSSCQS